MVAGPASTRVSCGEELADAAFDIGARPAEALAADGNQATRIWAARSWRSIKVKRDRGGGHAALEQAGPGGEVAEVEEGIGTAETDLLGEDGRVGGTGAAGNERAGIAEDGCPQLVGKLVEILVSDGQGQAIFAGLRQNEREALGGEGLKLVGIEMKGPTFRCGCVGSGTGQPGRGMW